MNFRTIRPSLLAAAIAVSGVTPALAQDGMGADQQQPPPATQPATQGQGRPIAAVMTDIQGMQQELAGVMSDPAVLSNPELRDQTAEKAIPVLKKLAGLMAEAAAAAPNPVLGEQMQGGVYQIQAILVGFGDGETEAKLKAEESVEAKSALSLGHFVGADDSAGKMAAVQELDALATDNPENAAVAQAAIGMASLGERDAEVATAAKKIINEKLKGEMAEQLKAALKQMEEAQKAEREFVAKFMDKPLAIEGQKLGGGTVSIADYKGKVLMVDFWATWCPPCIAALPKVKEDYAKYKDQGFEVLGVSLDYTPEPLKKFLADNPEMTWTQIYTESDPTASAKIAEGLGITVIPTVFLLDRNGNVRAVALGGGDQMEALHKMIPELLKEEAAQAE